MKNNASTGKMFKVGDLLVPGIYFDDAYFYEKSENTCRFVSFADKTKLITYTVIVKKNCANFVVVGFNESSSTLRTTKNESCYVLLNTFTGFVVEVRQDWVELHCIKQP